MISSPDAVGKPQPLVQYQQVALAYRGDPILQDITGQLQAGSLTAIVGPNGAGKSTLLRATLGLHPVQHGHIQLGLARHQIAYLAQQAQIDRHFPVSVLDAVMLGYWPSSRLWRRVSAAQREHALQALGHAGLLAQAHQPVGVLSAGQFQRMLFVRVQLQDAGLIVLDEPFNAVDADTTQLLLGQIARWHAEGRTVLAVLHDYDQVRRSFPETLLLGAGRLIGWGATHQVLCTTNLQLAAAPRPMARAAA